MDVMACSNYQLIYKDINCRINKQLFANLKPASPTDKS